MLRVGLTGGIGSGKSTIANYFSKLGVPIADADTIARDITSNQMLLKKIEMHFGKKVLNERNFLNRSRLHRLVFRYPQERRWLEDLLHPAILSIMREKLKEINFPYCILVIPLLREILHSINFVDRILVVDVSTSLQIQRVKTRDHISEKQVKSILKSQSSGVERLRIANDVIINNKTTSTLRNLVFQLHSAYLKLAEQN
ncbi:dephospho-CoA kinase [Coxiella endosymbiont of Amblyomma sculptum]|uniref:dephospho-CoA kinase n=1 Tax=Coxiella endosymbiont of Amblyomma sculptum TaxID=2487929 RepID=UPI00132F2962|nr:dephospho-CoA kinase [Coxiella endosymbiont of Amblyomma sculptum]QHG92418.1 dephospho-CoA kinase [Coxiella endosymbiont of Amblyomma sculptum]